MPRTIGNGYSTYADSTLTTISKKELIHIIRCLESNLRSAKEANDRQYKMLTEQEEIVHCKDCKNWKIVTIETIYGKTVKIGQCELTKWLCGEQGYCMYARKEE